MQARARARASITNHDHCCRRRRREGYMAWRREPAARPRTRSTLRVLMRCWTTPGTDSTDSRAKATRSKHLTTTYSARARHVHGTTQAARSGSLPCSLGSASAPHGCPVPWVLPGDHAEQGWTTGGKCGRLSGPPRVTKIELRKTFILFGRLYIARSRSPTPTTFVTRVVREGKDAIEPPATG